MHRAWARPHRLVGRCAGRLADRRAHLRSESPMIITRSPLRISLGGGGTALPSYHERHSGFLTAAAIEKYIYITLHHTFVAELIIKYSKMERVRTIEEV